MSDKLQIYHSLPYPLKVIGATLHGFNLYRWRYGRETERLVLETLERDTWSTHQWKTWREERLSYILHQAATKAPYYRDLWQKRRATGDNASWEILENWPVLNKNEVRENPRQFILDTVNQKSLYIDHTGGTTGKPTLIYESRNTIHQWYAIYEARIRRWYGLNYHENWGIFGGQKIIPLSQKKPPFWVWNEGLNQIYFSIFHINASTVKYYVEALWKYMPSHLIVYPSAFAILSKFILQEQLTPPKIKLIVCNSEKLLPNYRELISKAFGCPLMETYGMAEMSAAANECPDGELHFWPETGIMEIFNSEENTFSVESNSIGQFALTGLLNEDMPLIRYVNNDMGQLPAWIKNSKCGRNLPILNAVIGRSKDLIKTRDGRELYILDTLFNGLPIVEGQLIQYEIDSFEVKVIPDTQYNRQFAYQNINNRLSQYLGNINLIISEVSELEINANGKFKPFISLIDN